MADAAGSEAGSAGVCNPLKGSEILRLPARRLSACGWPEPCV